MWKRLFRRDDGKPSAARQQGDVHALDRSGDPRGGVQSDEYRHARPEDLVEEDGVAMAGPAGAPAVDGTVEEQRERDRPDEPTGGAS
jgi:hypothetical protein